VRARLQEVHVHVFANACNKVRSRIKSLSVSLNILDLDLLLHSRFYDCRFGICERA
jgi:hypothetical protein